MKISVCGKGGSGKSTIVALLANAAQERELHILVIDSDESNSGLFRMLGFKSPPVPLMRPERYWIGCLKRISTWNGIL